VLMGLISGIIPAPRSSGGILELMRGRNWKLFAFQDRVLHMLLASIASCRSISARDRRCSRPQFYLTFRKGVVPLLRLIRRCRSGWRFSTGEEVRWRSCSRRNTLRKVRIYATDISQAVLRKAQREFFPLPPCATTPRTT